MEFTLPKGYLDSTGILHRRGVMRLATAADEILPLRDPRVQQNEAYLAIIVLARVITRLGDLASVTPGSSRACTRPTSTICSASTNRSTAAMTPTRSAIRTLRSAPQPSTARYRQEDSRPWGSFKAYPEQLREEMAFIAYHFHWG